MIRKFLLFIRELARELSDENAYARHLARINRPHSRHEWQRFIDARHRRKYSNAKCC